MAHERTRGRSFPKEVLVIREFELIERHFASLNPTGEAVIQGPGDDCARVRVPADRELAISIDTLVEGVHFPVDTDAADIGHKALACGLSDLAASGATPVWCMLALALPAADESWIARFASGFGDLAREYEIALVGGDMTRGPLSATVQVAGHVPTGAGLTRAGARPGHDVYVSGTPGEAAAGLARLQSGSAAPGEPLLARLNRPCPRVRLGERLRGLATACVDVSDGLIADLGHILHTSRTGARLDLGALPTSTALRAAADPEQVQRWILHGGDDYELCFCAPSERAAELAAFDPALGGITRIGTVEAQAGIRGVHRGESAVSLADDGYRHFD